MTTRTQFFALTGGLDLITPAIRTPAGRAIAASNYEPHPRGYQRVDGFERFDGQPRPSKASYWVLNFDAGILPTTAADSTTNNNDGTLTNGPTWVSDGPTENIQGALSFDGVDDQVTVGDVAALNFGTGDFTLEAWINITSTSGGNSVFHKGKTINNDVPGYEMAVTGAGLLSAAVGDGTNMVRPTGPTAVNDGAWHHVQLVREGTTIKIRLDGADEASGSDASLGDTDNTDDFLIGSRVQNFYDGKITDERAWNVSRSLTQTADNMNTRLNGDESGLVGYWRLNDGLIDNIAAEGDVVTGGTSGATGEALIDSVTESLTNNTSSGYLVLTNVSGDFQDDETITSASGTATVNGTNDDRGADNDTDDATWLQDAIETVRADIAAVPGSGPVRGVWTYDGDTYAFRDNAGGTAGVMHKATTSGWSAQSLGNEIAFDAGTAAFTEGQTLTGGTSSATATINRVVLEDGDWSTNDAVGRLILGTVTGSFQNNETITDGAGGSATSDGADTAITLPAGGRYDFDNNNFFGASDLKRMYGANGVGRGFEWDGTVFVPINTGMTDDRPTRVAAHRNHLFFSFRGGSVQHSSIGNPYQWDVITGAGELGIGEETTDMLPSVSGVLAIFGLNKVSALFGDDASNWELRTLNDSAGAVAWTAQTIGMPIYLDNRGLRTMETTEQFGDFLVGTITQMVEPIFRTKQKAGVTPVGSIRVRSKDQYRLYWSDGTGITVYFGRDPIEILPFDLGFTITCTSSGKDSNGDERLFAGDEDGFVYELDAGTSFDGSAVDAFIRLPFNHVGTPAQRKRWQKASLEVDSGPDTQLGIIAEFGYANPDQPPGVEQSFSVKGGGGLWDESNWDDFYWSSPVEGIAEAHIDGMGRNMSIAIVSEATYEQPHILHGLILHFTYRGIAR